MIFCNWQKKLATSSSPHWIIDIGYLSVFFVIFYTFFLGSYPFFTPDEGRYAEIAREMAISHDYITPRVNGMIFLDKPVLYYWLQILAINLFGVKEWSLRLIPVLTGLFTCIITYVTGKYLFDRHTGLLSALILATTPLFFGSAHYANLDLEVAAFISSCLLFFIIAIFQKSSRKRRYFMWAVYTCTALAVLTKGLIGIVLPAMIIITWLMISKQWHKLKKISLLSGMIIFLLLVLPWYLLAQYYNPAFFHYFFVNQHFSRFLSTGSFNNPSPVWFYLPIISIGFYPWIIFLIPAVLNAIKKQAKELYLLLWIGIVFIFFSIPHSKIISYILPIYPPLALLVGHYLSSHFRQMALKSIILYCMIFVLLSGLLFVLMWYFILASFPNFLPHLYVIGVIFLIAALLTYYAIRNNSLPLFIFILLASNFLFLLTLTHGAKYLNTNTAKPLIVKLKKIKENSDEIISYFKYFYDVPLYLGEKIYVVADWQANNILKQDNWRRELWYGQQFQGNTTNSSLMDENTFWTHFHNGNKRVFVFLNENSFEKFQTKALYYFNLGKFNDIILLSNQPIIE